MQKSRRLGRRPRAKTIYLKLLARANEDATPTEVEVEEYAMRAAVYVLFQHPAFFAGFRSPRANGAALSAVR